MDKQMMPFCSLLRLALNKTTCSFVLNHAFPHFFCSVKKRTLQQRGLFDFYAVGPLSNNVDLQGRTCEVGPPASGLSYFTAPYSHYVLNGVLLCEADGYRRH
jgi:hypothetical protein